MMIDIVQLTEVIVTFNSVTKFDEIELIGLFLEAFGQMLFRRLPIALVIGTVGKPILANFWLIITSVYNN